ncbi:MAG TPA: diaminopimelate epimerase [Mycobacteriales bacterium]|nr:diaminopimelate epimerase [Mycobacteriales bacterium]
MPFSKGHGTENDFVLLPDHDGALDVTPELVRALCDRRAGIGGDGLLRVVRTAAFPGAPEGAEWFMDYRNADGSIAEMCGNGVRVFVRYLLEQGLAEPGRFAISTRAGVRDVIASADSVTVDMGPPVFGPSSSATLDGATYPGANVSMGNPHLVCPVSVPLDTFDLTRTPGYDPAVFPDGVNVEFVVAAEGVDGADLHVAMRVHERGVGETRSCGTGACAVAAAALRDRGLDRGTVAVDVPGGRVTVTLDGVTCLLTGPAVIVASGVLGAVPTLAR